MIYALELMYIPYMEPFVGYYQYTGWYYMLFVVLCALLLGVGIPSVIVLGIERYHQRLKNNTNANSHIVRMRSAFEICLLACVILYVVIGMFVNIDRWNSKQVSVVTNIQSAIMQGKSNKYISVKPYKKVTAIANTKELLSVIAINDSSVTRNQATKTFKLLEAKPLVKYQDGKQELFTDDRTSVISKPSYVKKPMTVKVYNVCLTNLCKHYLSHKYYSTYRGKRVVITSYVKFKPISWRPVK